MERKTDTVYSFLSPKQLDVFGTIILIGRRTFLSISVNVLPVLHFRKMFDVGVSRREPARIGLLYPKMAKKKKKKKKKK